MSKFINIALSTWVIVVLLSVIELFTDLSLTGMSVGINIVVFGQALKWSVWMLLSIPAILLSQRVGYANTSKILWQILIGLGMISVYMLLFNLLLFMSEGIQVTWVRYWPNLKIILSQELLKLAIFYTGLVFLKNYIDRSQRRIVSKNKNNFLEELKIKTGDVTVFVKVSDVQYFEADGYCVKVRMQSRQYILRKSLSELEKELDPKGFIRIHRSYMVNVNFLKTVHNKNGTMKLILDGGEELIVSKRKMSRVKTLLMTE